MLEQTIKEIKNSRLYKSIVYDINIAQLSLTQLQTKERYMDLIWELKSFRIVEVHQRHENVSLEETNTKLKNE